MGKRRGEVKIGLIAAWVVWAILLSGLLFPALAAEMATDEDTAGAATEADRSVRDRGALP